MLCKCISDTANMFFNSPSETDVKMQLRKYGWYVNDVKEKKKSLFFSSALPKVSSTNYKFHEMFCVRKGFCVQISLRDTASFSIPLLEICNTCQSSRRSYKKKKKQV